MNFSPTRKKDGSYKTLCSRSPQTPLGDRAGHCRNIGLGLFWLSLLFLSGCAALKKTALIAGASSIGAGVGGLVSNSVGAIVGAATGASAGVVVTALQEPETISGQPITAETVVAQAPTNLWDVVSQFGLWAGLIILIPLVLGILLPGPVQFKRRG